MPLFKHTEDTWSAVADDPWTLINHDDPIPQAGDIAAPPPRLTAVRAAVKDRDARLGVTLDSDEGPENIAHILSELDLVAVSLPKFTDGRAYSTARLLRTRYKFTGEIRAIGAVLIDQAGFLVRCGVDALDMPGDVRLGELKAAVTDIAEVYQTSADTRLPVWRARTGANAEQ